MWKRILKESEEKAAGTHAAGWLRELREALEKVKSLMHRYARWRYTAI